MSANINPHNQPAPAMEIIPAAYYSPLEAANLLRVTKQTLAVWRCRGRGPAYIRIGKLISYRGCDLAEFLNDARVMPGKGKIR